MRIAIALAASLLLAACATEPVAPTAMGSVDPAAPSGYAALHVSADRKPDVVMTGDDLERVTLMVRREIEAAAPGRYRFPEGAAPNGARLLDVRMTFTKFDRGSAVARAMLIGLGQIHLAGDVELVDAATGRAVGRYQVEKQFALGGIVGGVTTMEDVEVGFAKSVAKLFVEAKQAEGAPGASQAQAAAAPKPCLYTGACIRMNR